MPLSVTASSSAVSGGVATLTGAASGGTAPYSYAWSVVSKPGGANPTFSLPDAVVVSGISVDGVPSSLLLSPADGQYNISTISTDPDTAISTGYAGLFYFSQEEDDAYWVFEIDSPVAGGEPGLENRNWETPGTISTFPTSAYSFSTDISSINDPDGWSGVISGTWTDPLIVSMDLSGSYTFRVTATDAASNTATDDVMVNFSAVAAPVARLCAAFGFGFGF